VNGGQDGGPGFPAPDGGQWPNDGPAQGGTPYGAPPPAPYGGQPGYGNTQPGPYGGPTGPLGPGGPVGPGGQYPQGMWAYGQGAEPPKKSRKGLVTGLVVAAAVVVLGGAAAAVGVASSGDDNKPAAASGAASPSSSPSEVDEGVPHSLTVPRSAGGYRRLTGSVADRLASAMRKSMGEGSDADGYSKARFAIYTKGGSTARPLLFIGIAAGDSPAIAEELKTNSPSQEVDSMFLNLGFGDAKDYPAGPLGGSLRCGKGSMSGTTGVACGWADSSTSGLLLAPGTSGVANLASTTLALRNAAEH
jgi:hypothetical protein